MTHPIRMGILSFAHYHANFWSEALRDSPLAEFIGVWDADADRGNKAASTYGVKFWPELEALLEACEAVGVCSETVHHAALIEQAANKGCHILCEKPLATNLEDCERIERAVTQTGITFMQSFPKRFDPVNHELKRLLREDAFGKVSLVRVRHGHFHGVDPEFANEWYVDPKLSGGGTLLDEGVHGADFLRWLFGEPETVTAMISSETLRLPVEDTAVAVYRYGDGLIAELSTGWSLTAAENSIEIYGTGGTALVSAVDLASRDISQAPYLKTFRLDQGERRWMASEVVPQFKLGEFHHQVALNFLKALRDGTPPPVTLADGRRALAMILAAYRAAATGRAQTIE